MMLGRVSARGLSTAACPLSRLGAALGGCKFVDISVPLKSGIKSDPPGFCPEIEYIDHAQGAEQMAEHFPGLKTSDLPAGEGWAIEQISLCTHSGTHLDAPYHFASTQDGGARALPIDEVPLDWCFGRGVKLDFRHLPDGHVVSAAEVDAELARVGHALQPRDIVLVNTAAGVRYGHDDYLEKGCGMGREATLHLLEQGVRLTGTDAWSWDAPFKYTRERWLTERDPSIIWEGHKAGATIGYCHIEKLANLETLPGNGFYVSSFPVKIHAASAGWTRAVAIVPQADDVNAP